LAEFELTGFINNLTVLCKVLHFGRSKCFIFLEKGSSCPRLADLPKTVYHARLMQAQRAYLFTALKKLPRAICKYPK